MKHFKIFFRENQCCGAGASRSRGFLAGAEADLKLELWQVKTKRFEDVGILYPVHIIV